MNEVLTNIAIKAQVEHCISHVRLQEFAELIVRECADIANKQFNAATGLDDRDCWAAAEIKKRFGVEE